MLCTGTATFNPHFNRSSNCRLWMILPRNYAAVVPVIRSTGSSPEVRVHRQSAIRPSSPRTYPQAHLLELFFGQSMTVTRRRKARR